MYIEYPKHVGYIMGKLNEAGYAAYIVGGCVRDSLLGIKPHDWDITTDATPEQVKAVFKMVPGVFIVPTGEKYGTVTAVMDADEFSQLQYEITTFRYDANYSDGRRPDKVRFGKSILDDLMRRDFTINAMAYNKHVGLVDPYNGEFDLANGILKCVGNPIERLNEDALRVLRGLRFASRFGFKVENSTLNVMIANTSSVLRNISKERIHDELIKIFTYSKNNQKLIDEFAEFWFDLFELKDTGGHEDGRLFIGNEINNDLSVNLKLFKIFQKVNFSLYQAEIWLRKYKFSNKDTIQILNYMKINTMINDLEDVYYEQGINVVARKLLNKFSLNDLLTYTECLRFDDTINKDIFIKNKEMPFNISHLKITGKDLKKLGFKEGKEIGNILKYLLNKVIIEPNLNTKNSLNELIILYTNKIKGEN